MVLPLTTPELRRSSGKYLTRRGLWLANGFIRKGVLRVLGSPWLPGFWVISPEEAQAGLYAFQKNSRQCPLFLSITNAPVKATGWHSFEGDPFMVLNVQWNNWEEYVAAMKKKYRARVRKTLKVNAALEVVSLPLTESNLEHCAQLLEETLKDKVVALPGNLTRLLGMFQDCFESNFKIYGFKNEGSLVGFISCVRDGDVLRAMHFGATDEAPEDFYSFAMFTLIKDGIESKVNKIDLGRTATEIKSTYGAVAEQNYFSFYSSGCLFKLALKLADHYYVPKPYTLRSPFGDVSK